nr:hypothetical protein [Tanacetum cinerariifolium]
VGGAAHAAQHLSYVLAIIKLVVLHEDGVVEAAVAILPVEVAIRLPSRVVEIHHRLNAITHGAELRAQPIKRHHRGRQRRGRH